MILRGTLSSLYLKTGIVEKLELLLLKSLTSNTTQVLHFDFNVTLYLSHVGGRFWIGARVTTC